MAKHSCSHCGGGRACVTERMRQRLDKDGVQVLGKLLLVAGPRRAPVLMTILDEAKGITPVAKPDGEKLVRLGYAVKASPRGSVGSNGPMPMFIKLTPKGRHARTLLRKLEKSDAASQGRA
jgi:hypothetical protein